MDTEKDYRKIATEVRRNTLALIHKGQTSHTASCFSLVDMAVVLYENLQPEDIVVWSKGWAAALHYTLEIRRGKLDKETVFSTFPNDPYLGLLEKGVPTVVTAGGSVGHGLSVGVGMAYARKLEGKSGKVYVIMSDGEMNEGSVWEAALFAAHHKLDNLVGIIDKNSWQAMGRTEEVMSLDPLDDKWKAFNWEPRLIDGHDHETIFYALTQPTRRQGHPLVIIGETIKGKGVSFFEDHLLYHYKHVDDETYAKALEELV